MTGPSGAQRYHILEVLGVGGFGTVYRAESESSGGLRREVALKVLNPEAAGNHDAAMRLRDEARILSHLHTQGIIRVEDLLLINGRWTMVMELVHGVDLERLIAREGALPLGAALEIIAAVADTLETAWASKDEQGRPLQLVHRDIKPANILITPQGGVKLLDFGVARAEIDEREADTQQAYVMGSLPYLAPERYGFEDLPAGDVYSLGCVFYELLTGERFGRTRPSHRPHLEQVREALHGLWGAVPATAREDSLRLLGEMLAFEPDMRPAAGELAMDCRTLAQSMGGAGLSRWAQRVVPPLLAAGYQQVPDALCGTVLGGDDDSTTMDPVPVEPVAPEPPTRSEPGRRWPWVVAALVLLTLGLGLAAWGLWPEPEPPALLQMEGALESRKGR